MTPRVKNQKPRSISSGGPKSSRGSKSVNGQHYAHTHANASDIHRITRDMNMSDIPEIIMFISPQIISLPTRLSTLTPLL